MPFLYKDELNSDRDVKAASVAGWRMDTHFHFKVVELWPAGTSTYVFFAEAKPLNPPTKYYYWLLSASDAGTPIPEDEEDDFIEGG